MTILDFSPIKSSVAYSDNSAFLPVLSPWSVNTGSASQGAKAPLGITTKYVSTFDSIEFFSASKPRFKRLEDDERDSVSRRYALQRAVSFILPKARTAACGRRVVPGKAAMILANLEGKAFFGNVQVCGSVWNCPVCQAKVAERRRAELMQAVIAAKRAGLQVLLLTATVPHGAGDDLADIVGRISKAWRHVHAGRSGERLKAIAGRVGFVRSLEVTHGEFGFHPHFHCLLFCSTAAPIADVENCYKAAWRNACINTGFQAPSAVHGLTVQDGSAASSYVCKWGIETEMTRWQSKRGKSGNLTPFDFVRRYMEGGAEAERYAKLFSVYAAAFKGRRQLFWSHGLRDRLDLGSDVTDPELAAQQREPAKLVATLSPIEFKAVTATHKQALLLECASKRSDKVPIMLDAIVEIWLGQIDYVPKWYWKRRVPLESTG